MRYPHPRPRTLSVRKALLDWGLGELGNEVPQIGCEIAPQARVLQAELHSGLQVSELAAAVVPLALEFEGIHRLTLHQPCNPVGELNLAPGTFADFCQIVEDRGGEQVAPDDGQRGLRLVGLGLFDDVRHLADTGRDIALQSHYAVLVR